MSKTDPNLIDDKDLTALSEAARKYARAALSSSTQRGYKSDFEDFVYWCHRVNRKSLPATPETVALYLTQMSQHLRTSSLRRRVTAICRAHELSKFPSPTTDSRVKTVLRGIIRTKGEAVSHASPTLMRHITDIIASMPDSLKGKRDTALLLLGFAGGFRRSELVGLDVEDVSLHDEGLVLNLSRSKTDQTGRGRKVPICYGTKANLCPVRAFLTWLSASHITAGPLFRPIDQWGYLGDSRLTGQSVRLILRESLLRAGISPRGFSGHSLRAGFVTVAFINGASEREIQSSTGHTNANVLRRYHRDANLFRQSASKKLGL